MSEAGQGGERDTSVLRCAPYPTEWIVQCPSCGAPVAVNMTETEGGVFSSGDSFGDPFVACRDCGAVIHPTDAYVTTAPPPSENT